MSRNGVRRKVPTQVKPKKPRYGALDALRGFSLILMVIHHAAYNLALYGFLPSYLVTNPVVLVLHLIFASVFIGISGACSTYSKNNYKRGALILIAAAVVTIVTFFFDPENFVRFGILHF